MLISTCCRFVNYKDAGADWLRLLTVTAGWSGSSSIDATQQRWHEQVIANMTVGKDVAMLFTDVINCIQTGESHT